MTLEKKAKLIQVGKTGSEFVIERTPYIIGRRAGNGLFIPDYNVSREQAIIEEKLGIYTIRDNSTNGTLLNHRPLGKEAVELHDDDVISINRTHVYTFISADKTMPVFNPLFSYGLEIDPNQHQIYVDGVAISPDNRGYLLITLLAETPGKIYTYSEIGAVLYPDDRDPESQVKRIRAAKNDLAKRLKAAGVTRQLIKSRSGIGYQLISN